MKKLVSSVCYLFNALRHPSARKLGFINQGFGLANRHSRFSSLWERHLKKCKEAQRSFFEALPEHASELVVLGAGRGYDFNLNAAQQQFQRILLVDADPSVRPSWNRLAKNSTTTIDGCIADTSGVLEDWSELFSLRVSHLKGEREERFNAAVELIKEIPARLAPDPSYLPFDTTENQVILSLNILSQIPLAWQRVIEHNLRRNFGTAMIEEKENEWLEAYCYGGTLLIRQHLAQLRLLTHFLLITDETYSTSPSELVSLTCGLSIEEELKGATMVDSWQWQITPDERHDICVYA